MADQETARGLLEFDHIVPFAVGGEATVENVRLLCKSHNRHEADLYFGPRGPNGRGGLVREEIAPYGLAGGSLSRLAAGRRTRFKTSSVQPP